MTVDSLFDRDTLPFYLRHQRPNIPAFRLQLTLYFLFAYYGAVYGQIEEDGVFEGSLLLPQFLFPATFVAGHFGALMVDVWEKDNTGYYSDPILQKQSFDTVHNNLEMNLFIDNLFRQIESVPDLHLIPRACEDHVWKSAYKIKKYTPIQNQDIILEYKNRWMLLSLNKTVLI